MQNCRAQLVGWDVPLPKTSGCFLEWRGQLDSIQDVRLPRRVFEVKPCSFESHVFCDASDSARGTKRGTKRRKKLLRRTLGTQIISFEELSTLFCEIEQVLNSRPIVEVSCDPRDLAALTPSMMLGA